MLFRNFNSINIRCSRLFRDKNNLVIPKKKKFIITSKIIEESSKYGKGVLSEQSYSVEASKRPEAMGSIQFK